MRLWTRTIVAIALVFALHGCSEQPAPSGESPAVTDQEIVVTESDSAGVAIVTISGSVAGLPEWSLSETPLTEISGHAPPHIGRVGEVAFWGERRLLVEDRQGSELYSFGTDGQVLQLLAGAGDGPGEIRGVAQLSVTPGDTVYAFDTGPYRISVSGPNGDFLTSMQVDPTIAGRGTQVRDAWALGSDRFLLLGRDFGAWPPPSGRVHLGREEGVLQVISADGTEHVAPIRFAGNPYVVIDGPRTTLSPFWNRPFLAVNGDRVLRGLGVTYELVLLDRNLMPTRVIRWLDWREPLTASVLEALRDSLEASASRSRTTRGAIVDARIEAAMDQRMEAIFHADVLPEALPALHSALLDEKGGIWVSRFQPAKDMTERSSGNTLLRWRQEDIWHVLDSNGSPVARLRLPTRTRLLAVRSDRIAVVTRDEVDLEHVRVFAINRGGEAPRNPF